MIVNITVSVKGQNYDPMIVNITLLLYSQHYDSIIFNITNKFCNY